MSADRIWVLMAWDGPKEYAESWYPAGVFVGPEPPSRLERGRLLVRAARQGQLPWTHHGGGGAEVCRSRPTGIDEVCTLVEIPADLAMEAVQ